MDNDINSRLVVVALICILHSAASYSAELEAEMAIGLDQNPNRFSSSLSKSTGEVMSPSIKGEIKVFDDIGILGSFSGTYHNKEVDDADNERLELGLFYDTKFKAWGKRSNFRSELVYGYRDKTYVSRTTGNIATFSGNQIADRYDYDYFGLNNELKIRLNRKNRITAALDMVVKDYEDYRISTLDNLDYQSIELGASWLHKFDKKHSLRSQFSFENRDYDDRRQADQLGNDIIGTDLSYTSTLGRLVYTYRPSKALRMNFSGLIDMRTDNGGGYYDATRLSLRYGLSYKMDRWDKVRSSISYSSYDYTNRQDNPDPQNDELSEEDAIKFKLSYHRAFKKDEGLEAFAAFRYDYVTSDVNIYEHDRFRVEIGVTYEFKSGRD